jgi:hypothetical protein
MNYQHRRIRTMKTTWWAASALAILPQWANALDLTLQPRFKTGIQYYEYEQEPFQSPARDPLGRFPNTQSGLGFSDWLPFVSAGVSLFVDRFFIDIEGQKSYAGRDQSEFSNQNFLTAGGPFRSDTVLQTRANQDSEFDRVEWSISVGLEVIDHLAVFAGYKNAQTSLDTSLRGVLNGFDAQTGAINPLFAGPWTGRLDQRFDYDGPFIGATYYFPIQHGFLDGALSFNFAAAFMEGTVNLNFRDVVVNTAAGAIPLDFQSFSQTQGRGSFSNLKGDNVGFSFGAAWRGLTQYTGLTYLLGVAGYRYEFDSDTTPNFSENQVRLDFSIAYELNL